MDISAILFVLAVLILVGMYLYASRIVAMSFCEPRS